MSLCSIDDCGRPTVARGWCDKHYRRWKWKGDPTIVRKPRPVTPCSVQDCARPNKARGLCAMHYQRWVQENAPGQIRTCPRCGDEFKVALPSSPKVHCSQSCGAKGSRPPRPGPLNSNWRGGKASHPLYEVYQDMIRRCHVPTHTRYASYGGRGITVCERWRNDFWAYVDDVGARPAPGMSIDRVDNDGNYEPGNVRWATASEQMRNRRDSAYAGSRHDPVTGQFLPSGVAV